MNQIINQISLVLILLLSQNNLVQAESDIVQGDISWFSSNTSELLNRSSMELATNHVKRGIRYAYRALEQNLNPMDELIANHNLCIAYLALDKSEISPQYCVRTFKLAQGEYNVVKVRGAYRLQNSDVNNTQIVLTPTLMVASNILQQNSQTRLTLLCGLIKDKVET